MPKLEPFDVAAWENGFEIDLNSRAWGGKGWKGRNWSKARRIKVKTAAKVKGKIDVRPAISVLTSEHDNEGRSLADHRAMVEWYADRYASGQYPFGGEAVTEEAELRAIDRPWKGELRDIRHSHSANDGLELLKKAFAKMAENDSD